MEQIFQGYHFFKVNLLLHKPFLFRKFEFEKLLLLQKFKSYLLDSNLISRLHAKHSTLQKALGDDASKSPGGIAHRPPSLPPKPNKQRRIGKSPIVGRPKVFGCNLEEYVEVCRYLYRLYLKFHLQFCELVMNCSFAE